MSNPSFNPPLCATATLVAACLLAAPASAAHWIGAWSASPQASWGPEFALPTGVPARLERQSVREVLRLGLGGRRVRVVLSNRYGATPLTLGAVHLARAAGADRIVAGTDHGLTFGGQTSVTVAPGATIVSDALDWPLAALDLLAVTTYFPRPTTLSTFHWGAQQTGYISAGTRVAAPALAGATPLHGRLFLSAVHVDAGAGSKAVAVLGDSITDGNGSTPDRNRRWPDWLAQRLAPHGVAVLNAGISGARLLGDGMGQPAALRFGPDVLAQPGVASVIVLLGINDIGWPGSAFAPHAAPMTAATLIAAYRQLIALAHGHGVRIIGATLTPFEGALHGTPLDAYYNEDKEKVRQQVNAWLRASGAFDGMLDADAVLRDPARPRRLLPAYDSGDHLHPGDAGYRALAGAVDTTSLLAAHANQH